MIKKIPSVNKLSILIPVYNYKVVELVKKLYNQCQKEKIEFEILVFDDVSKEKFKSQNKILSNIFGVNYMELSENLGRAKIRNWLVKSALYNYVLLLDCDAKINNNKFIKNYLDAYEPNTVVNGGRKYSKSKPRAKSKYLHWLYGTKNESKNAKERAKKKHLYFHSNNFAAPRDILIKHPFEEQIEGYGYEDLVIAKKLISYQVKLKYIDNPVIHMGLEKSEVFVQKSMHAIENLKLLNKQGNRLYTRVEYWAEELKAYHLVKPFLKFVGKRKETYLANLSSEKPKLYQLQLLKLHQFLSDE